MLALSVASFWPQPSGVSWGCLEQGGGASFFFILFFRAKVGREVFGAPQFSSWSIVFETEFARLVGNPWRVDSFCFTPADKLLTPKGRARRKYSSEEPAGGSRRSLCRCLLSFRSVFFSFPKVFSEGIVLRARSALFCLAPQLKQIAAARYELLLSSFSYFGATFALVISHYFGLAIFVLVGRAVDRSHG